MLGLLIVLSASSIIGYCVGKYNMCVPKKTLAEVIDLQKEKNT